MAPASPSPTTALPMRLIRSAPLILSLALFTLACASSEGSSADAAPDSAAPASAPSQTTDPLVAAGDRSRILGDSAAPVWVIIVSDFQCPYCKVWHDQTFPALKREFVDQGRIRLAYVNLPLPQHQHARATAELALCAGAQGRFWEYHDALFDTQAQWSPLQAGTPFFDSLATRAGVDTARLKSCMDADTMGPLVEADYQKSMAAKVGSTPTFIIGNDIRLTGAQPIAAFREAIERARTAVPPAGRR